MALIATTLSTVSAATETDLFVGTTAQTALIKNVVICNDTAAASDIEVTLTNVSNTKLARLAYPRAVAVGQTIVLPLNQNVVGTNKIRVKTSTANVSFTANGDDDFTLA